MEDHMLGISLEIMQVHISSHYMATLGNLVSVSLINTKLRGLEIYLALNINC